MEMATKSVVFSFNDTMYCQVDGISMGSPLGPILANIFVGFWEITLWQVSEVLYLFTLRGWHLSMFQFT